jgi:transcriptional regulator with XRE-family HTH domain
MTHVSDEERNRWLAALGAAIREARAARGLSQEALGHQAGLHRTYVSDMERGQRNTTAVTLLTLARTLGVAPSEILRRAEGLSSEA